MIKLLQILLATAVMNPLCCCNASGVAWEPVEDETASHGCCGASASEGEREKGPEHGQDNCPHQMGNGYKQIAMDHLAVGDHGFEPIFLQIGEVPISAEKSFRERGWHSPDDRQVAGRSPPGLYRFKCSYLI